MIVSASDFLFPSLLLIRSSPPLPLNNQWHETTSRHLHLSWRKLLSASLIFRRMFYQNYHWFKSTKSFVISASKDYKLFFNPNAASKKKWIEEHFYSLLLSVGLCRTHWFMQFAIKPLQKKRMQWDYVISTGWEDWNVCGNHKSNMTFASFILFKNITVSPLLRTDLMFHLVTGAEAWELFKTSFVQWFLCKACFLWTAMHLFLSIHFYITIHIKNIVVLW